MASSSITSVGGVVVVTQVIPQDQSLIPLQAADAHQQAPPLAAKAPPPASPSKMDDVAATFQRGEPQALGVIQIVIGLLCVLFSLTAVTSHHMMVHAVFASALWLLSSGSLTLVVKRRTSAALVWVCLVSNCVSVLLSVGGVAYLSWLMADDSFCDLTTFAQPVHWKLCVVLNGLRGLVLVLLLLQVAVAATSAVFSVKTLRLLRRRSAFQVVCQLGGNESAAA